LKPLVRLVACPDSLKGVFSAADAAAALAEGARSGGLAALELPLADGGEGTADAIARARGGTWRPATVSDPLGRRVEARFLLCEGVAVVEAAEAIGLARLAPGERDPWRSSSRGLGELVAAAVAAGATRVVVGLGGTATVDGGIGLREALPRLPVPVTAACDVRNPLLGPRGAARVFGPQKGASPALVRKLERRLASLPELAAHAEAPGAGAAGGLGAAFAALGADLVSGAEYVLEAVGLERVLAEAPAIAVTAEGAVDRSSAEGKVPGAVAAAAARAGVPCLVAGGTVEPDGARALIRDGATAVIALSGRPERAREDLRAVGEAVAGLVRRG
jgi:glycerate 2-kinase